EKEGGRTTTRDYLYEPGSYTPFAVRVDGRVYRCHTDHRGAPRRLTGPTGVVCWSADYTAFGAARVGTALVPFPLRLPGQYLDEETGLHYNRFRYYSPLLGRYLSTDPLRYFGGLNFYLYAGNDPINGIDPLGLLSFWGKVAVGLAAVAVGVLIVATA